MASRSARFSSLSLLLSQHARLTQGFRRPQEIHAKIMSLQLDDCKVYISNVDSQGSAGGSGAPAWSSSIEIWSGVRMKAM